MAPTPLTPVDRYIHPETATVYWVETIADKSSPTRAEIDAGTDLTGEVADAPNWTVSANRVAVPDLANRFTSRIAGRVDPGDSQVVFYASRDTIDIRDLLARGDQGYILILYGGDVSGTKMDVYQVEVVAVGKPIDVSGAAAAMITYDFAITSLPAEDVAVPA